MPSVDVLIVGQGLAGSTLAWRLAEVGLTFAVVDRGGRDDHGNPSASRVAAGLMTPVTGKRLTLDPEWDTLRDAAAAFYRRVERVAGAAFFHERPSLRLLRSDKERQRFEERAKEPLYATHMRPADADPRYNADATRHGGFVMPSAARLEAAAFLDATLDWLRSSGRLYEWSLDALNDLQLAPPRVLVPELNLAARVVVDCRGFTAADPLFTDSPALTPLKGEVLVVEGPGLPDDRVVHRGVWLVPVERGRGDEGQTRCLLGATYTPDDATSHPTPVGRAELLASLREFLSGEPRVVGHRAGVRPALPDRKPVAIISKADDRFACFNGLGAKGALSAPWHAGRLAEKLAALVRC